MTTCRACSFENLDTSRFCGSCAAPLDPATPASEIPTVAVAAPAARGSSPRTPPPSRISSEAVDEGRFTPGTLLADRYRIIDLLGRGGMGEVYRANDLKLGQAVALKFLPESAAGDEHALARFHNEVRISLQVSHPNVCRVYDIGEAGGFTYLSMEYVDGEDLATLLRRIGRFPPDRAIEIARHLCAGLAAAHEKGVLHRDLKPANVMIDSRGEVRITDFGLAGLADKVQAHEIRSGTPAYMAPEQLAGKEVSARSDIYSLGLVLYEIFAGRRAFEANNAQELMRMQEQSAPPGLTTLVRDLDPVVERVVLRCLDPDPRRRPATALAVAAALPGGDPLAAALAAGETPSPEMVAAAECSEGLSVRAGAICMTAVVAMLAAVAIMSGQLYFIAKTPFDNPPDVLADKARAVAETFGYPEKPVDRVYGFQYDADLRQYLKAHGAGPRMDAYLAAGQPAIVQFWYRHAPRYLRSDSYATGGAVTPDDPPLVPGALRLLIDPQGRLLYFEAVPPAIERVRAAPSPPKWAALFSAAGLEMSRFAPADPQWTPPVAFDDRAAWTGVYSAAPEFPLRIEAAAWRGRPVYFQIVAPWSRPRSTNPDDGRPVRTRQWMFVVIFSALCVGACVLARRNVLANRSDRRGAFRLGIFTLCVNLAMETCRASHVPELGEFVTLLLALGASLMMAAFFWVAYLALEPYVRRWWPQTMVSWSRILAGKLRDPVVGGDMLVGVVFGLIWTLLFQTAEAIGQRLGNSFHEVGLDCLLGWRQIAANLLGLVAGSIGIALFGFFLIFLLRLLLRKEWLAAGVFILLLTASKVAQFGMPVVIVPLFLVVYTLFVVFLLRFGLVPLIVSALVVDFLAIFPITLHFSAWHLGPSLFALMAPAALAAFGFHTSLAGRPIFRDELLRA
jgi:serine/threonine-protein kinase